MDHAPAADARQPAAPARAGAGERLTGRTTVGTIGTGLLGMGLLLTAIVLSLALIGVWPAVEKISQGDTVDQTMSFAGGITLKASAGTSFLLLVLVASAMGSFIHTATSFATYVGNRRFAASWIWWYILRMFVGSALAILFYFAIRGGIFSTSSAPDQVNPYGIAALAGLVGLFSKQATDKLREVFDTLFRTSQGAGDAERQDKVVNPRPRIDSIEPLTVDAGGEEATIAIKGAGFLHESVVQINQAPRPTTFASTTELTVRLSREDLAQPGSLDVVVSNPGPGGGTSDPVQLLVRQPSA